MVGDGIVIGGGDVCGIVYGVVVVYGRNGRG